MIDSESTASVAETLVSVICTVRNGARTIPQVVDSILQQTHSRLEFVIVDDGSTDETPRLLERLAADDSRLRIILTEGIGRGRALNRAIEFTSGEFIANIDADDPSHPQRLELQLGAMLRDDEFAVTCCDRVTVWDDAVPDFPTLAGDAADIAEITQSLTKTNPLDHSSVMMRRSALETVGGYDEQRTSKVDYDLWVRLALGGHRLGFIQLPLASKRVHSRQSFDNRRLVSSPLTTAEVQSRAIRGLGGGPAAWARLGVQCVWRLIPFRLRMLLRPWKRPT